MVESPYMGNADSGIGLIQKDQCLGSTKRIDFWTNSLNLQPFPMPGSQVDSAQMGFSTHDCTEEEGEDELFACSIFSSEDSLSEHELWVSEEEERDAPDGILSEKVDHVGTAAAGSKAECDLGLTNRLQSRKSVMVPAEAQVHVSTDSSSAAKAEVASEPIDIICSRNENSDSAKAHRKSYKSMASARESLLEEAWKRKRNHILHHKLHSVEEKPKLENVGRSASDCGKTGRLQSQASDRLSRMRSLTDDDFDELRGCIDLGFCFTQTNIPDLCETLPALEVCYAITQKLQDSQSCLSPVSTLHGIPSQSPDSFSSESMISSWQICSPGENPQQVKTRLRHWAQAVACAVRQCR